MTHFEKALWRNLTDALSNKEECTPSEVVDLVVDTLVDEEIPFFKENEDVTEYVFPPHLQKGSTFYWVTEDVEIDEYMLYKVVYSPDNGSEFPFEVYVTTPRITSIGYMGWDAYGKYIFASREEAKIHA